MENYSAAFEVKSPVNKFFQRYCDTSELPYDIVVKEELKLEPPEKSKVQYRIDGFKISKWYNIISLLELMDYMWWCKSIFSKNRPDPDWYTKLEGTMTVTETKYNNGGRACHAKLTVDFEKIPDEYIPKLRRITDACVQDFQVMDDEIVTNLKS